MTVYLDNAATTKMSDLAKQSMINAMDAYGNPSSLYKIGRASADLIKKSREEVADSMGVSPSNIIFTSGGSESNTTAINGCVDYFKEQGRTFQLCSSVEHKSVFRASEQLFNRGMFSIKIPVYDCRTKYPGCIDIDALEEKLKENNVAIVSVMQTNNEIGSENNTEKVAELCKKYGAMFHTDCVQSFGTDHFKIHDGIDFASVSSHKIHGPKGVGALYISDSAKKYFYPLICGGKQEYGIRGGTENTPGIVGFAAAASELSRPRSTMCRRNKERLKELLLEKVGANNVAPLDTGSEKILSCLFRGIDGESLVLGLSSVGVYCSSGSACSEGSVEPSYVLKAIGLRDDTAKMVVRFSVSSDLTVEELTYAAEKVRECCTMLKKGDD